jgi:hypothetical protein
VGSVIPGWSTLGIAVLSAACTGDAVGPISGALRVTAFVTGPGADPDGFLVVLDRSVRRPLTIGASVLLDAIAPGDHDVALEGLGPNCAVEGSAEQVVGILAGDTSQAAFEVSCQVAGATLRVNAQTTGDDLDPDGYDVLLDGEPESGVEPDGVTLFGVPAGTHTVTLGGVNPNCNVADPTSQTVSLSIGGLAGLQFEIQCSTGSRAGRGHEIAYGSTDPVTDQTAIYVVNDDGSHRERLFPAIPYGHGLPVWAPDGDRIAYYAFPDDSTDVLTVAEAGGPIRLEFPGPSGFFRPLAWAPDGSRLALGSVNHDCPLVHLLPLDGSGEVPVEVECSFGTVVLSLSWSPDGARLAFVARIESSFFPPTFYVAVADLAAPEESPAPEGCDFQEPSEVAWSPDGSRLAVVDGGIFVLDLAAATCELLTAQPGDGSPSWSPDGTRIAFGSSRDGNPEIYVMEADGSNQMRITRSPSFDGAPSWRP